ncbi:DUF4367 domain-containing protein [Pseudoflavonifractor sp. MSJ-37]|uniref:DUF4367 domain-containing protein n=1 Tax=Pseudoflavonifractor sp. MSJ-37 TaxID=2841531 RepID=UPI001C11630F|nr:DUF4367 domain-containing protein [Pseudoflavonifractor sp. MSJ-37]
MKITEEMLYQSAPETEALWLAALPTTEQVPIHHFSPKFRRKMRRLLRDQRRSPAVRQLLRMVRHAAVLILTVSVVGFSCLMTVEACREKVITIISEVFTDLTRFHISSTRKGGYGLGTITFGYLPEGMEEMERTTTDMERIIYLSGTDGIRLKFRQQMIDADTDMKVILDTEDAKVTATSIDGDMGTLVVKDDYTILMWEDDRYLFLLSGAFDADEIIAVANGVTIQE